MANYYIIWEIDVEADSAREAAELARDIQLDPASTATVFLLSRESAPGDADPEAVAGQYHFLSDGFEHIDVGGAE